MTDAQALELSLLGAILALDILFSDNTRQFFHSWGVSLGFAKGQAGEDTAHNDIALPVFWLIAAAVLLGMAYYWPKIALGVTALLLVGVILAHNDPIITWLQAVQQFLGQGPISQNNPSNAPAPTRQGQTSGSQLVP